MAWEHKETLKGDREYASKGRAVIRMGETKAKITFVGKDYKGNLIVWDNGEQSKVFHRDDLPETFRFEPKTEGEYYVCTSYNKEEVFSISPWSGSYLMVPYDITRDRDSKEPSFFDNTFKSKEGKDISVKKFKILWKITEDGEFKGAKVSQQHVYQSEYSGLSALESGHVAFIGKGTSDKAKWQPRLEAMLDRFQVTASPIIMPKDGNCLPEIWKRIESAPQKEWRMKIEEGEVVGFDDSIGKRTVQDVDFEEEVVPMSKRISSEKVAELKEEMGFDDEKDFPQARLAKKIADDEEDL